MLSGFYLYLFPFSPVGMAVSVGLTVLLCQMVEVPDHGRLAAITVALVMVISSGNPELPPFASAALRFIESVSGAGIAVLAVLLWPKAKEAANSSFVTPGRSGSMTRLSLEGSPSAENIPASVTRAQLRV
jgi:uncharacterized membrane protein YgaE (UPF0421/DUF939 family)